MKHISNKDLINYGIRLKHEQMENGELRFRLTSVDGSGYIRTVAGENGSWQNSHSHKKIKETYIIQSRWMAFAQLIDDKVNIKVYRQGDILTVNTNIIHNVYLPKGAVTHTIKHGTTEDVDWIACEEFDKKTKNLSEDEILSVSSK